MFFLFISLSVFSVLFVSIFAASITHGDSNTKLESIKIVDNALTVTFEDLAVEMDREVGEGEKEEKEEVYKCNFVVETPIEGVSGNFHREVRILRFFSHSKKM